MLELVTNKKINELISSMQKNEITTELNTDRLYVPPRFYFHYTVIWFSVCKFLFLFYNQLKSRKKKPNIFLCIRCDYTWYKTLQYIHMHFLKKNLIFQIIKRYSVKSLVKSKPTIEFIQHSWTIHKAIVIMPSTLCIYQHISWSLVKDIDHETNFIWLNPNLKREKKKEINDMSSHG